MALRQILFVSLLSVSAVAAADTLDIGLSNSTAQFKYGVPSGLSGKSEVYGELMYNDLNSVMGAAGVLIDNEQGGGFSVGVGAKALAATIKELPVRKGASAIALGMQLRFVPPADDRIVLLGDVFVSPKIMTYGDANRFQQLMVRSEFAISMQARVYVAYRKTLFAINNAVNDVVIANGPYLGLKMEF